MAERDDRTLAVVVPWAVAGAGLGLWSGLVAPQWSSVSGAAVGGVVGLLAGSAVARAWRGDRGPSWIDLVPRGVIAASLLGAGVVVTAVANREVGLLVALGAVGVAITACRPLARAQLQRAVDGLSVPHRTAGSLVALGRLARAWWAPAVVASEAAYQRGAWALWHEELDAADAWLATATHPRIQPHAAALRAVGGLLRGDQAAADGHLAQAFRSTDAQVRAAAEAARLLAVLRTDGPEVAARLGAPVVSATPLVPLAVGVVAAARWGAGDPDGARALLTPRTVAVLRRAGVVRVDEVRDVIAALSDDGAAGTGPATPSPARG